MYRYTYNLLLLLNFNKDGRDNINIHQQHKISKNVTWDANICFLEETTFWHSFKVYIRKCFFYSEYAEIVVLINRLWLIDLYEV